MNARVLVVGSPGAGKTTLSRRLGAVTGLPVRHLDDEYWGPDWLRCDKNDWVAKQAALTSGDAWIVDGNHLRTMPLRMPRATAVVLIDAWPPVCLARVVRRAVAVRLGRHTSLPKRVRDQAAAGGRVRATKDFLPLLRLVAGFRHREWWRVAELADQTGTQLVVVAGGRWSRGRAVMRCRLEQRGIAARVVGPAEVAGLFAAP